MAPVKTAPLPQAFKTLPLPELSRNLFSSRDWVEVIYKTYQTKLFVKYIEENGAVRSYIFYSVVRNFLEWKICILSYSDYCDCPVADVEDWRLLVRSLQEEYPRFRIAVRNLRDEHVLQCGAFQVLSQEKFHFLDVRGDLQDLWRHAHDSFKSAVKQSEKAGVSVKPCGVEYLPKFYELHLLVRKVKYKVFPQPYRFFTHIWNQYMENGRGVLLGAFDPQGKFIGGNMYLVCGNMLYYKFNTSSLPDLKFRPNNLLFWEGIKYAKSQGLDFIDLGSSGTHQTGLIRFKEHAGARAMDITHLGYAPPGYKFSKKRILRWMTSLFTQPWMPNFMVRLGSSIIYPFLA